MNQPEHLAALAARGAAYRPRTRHLGPDGTPRFTNALIHATSPYLLQHAHNPVDWRPWGEAAFAEARARGVPVFLSVGYSTCHWCHVMEHESFEDEAIAKVLNGGFVPIKLDREERPDVDAVYMAFVQLTTGHGGWPMSVWLTPEKRPLYAGTYFPARTGDRGSHMGFLQLLEGIGQIWRDPAFQAQADDALAAMTEALPPAAEPPDAAAVEAAVGIFRRSFDPVHGGFSRAPKFPRPSVLELLLRAGQRGAAGALAMVEKTLEAMYLGGLYDHVGGGFARYSTDARWRVPHFEKMLYDNAQLISAYLLAFRASGAPLWARVAREVLAYLDTEMSDPGGGFWSATDADSPDADGHGHEGLFFTWTPAELVAVLGPTDGAWVAETFGITEAGDFEGRGVLHLTAPLDLESRLRWAPLRAFLLAARAHRPPPSLDDKVITAWNALAISAFAQAGQVLGEPRFTQRARAAADFVWTHLRDPATGRLYRAWRHGLAQHPGLLEDHAAFGLACLDLLEATGDAAHFHRAVAIFALLDAHFADSAGGYFRTPDDGEALLFREKPDQDGAEPGGNALAAQLALRLATLTGDARYQRAADGTLRAFAALIERAPHAVPRLICALAEREDERLVVIVTPDGARPDALLAAVAAGLHPEVTVVFGPADGPLAAALPAFAHRTALGGQPTAYHCRGTHCDLPVTDPEALAALLGHKPA